MFYSLTDKQWWFFTYNVQFYKKNDFSKFFRTESPARGHFYKISFMKNHFTKPNSQCLLLRQVPFHLRNGFHGQIFLSEKCPSEKGKPYKEPLPADVCIGPKHHIPSSSFIRRRRSNACIGVILFRSAPFRESRMERSAGSSSWKRESCMLPSSCRRPTLEAAATLF